MLRCRNVLLHENDIRYLRLYRSITNVVIKKIDVVTDNTALIRKLIKTGKFTILAF